MKKLIVNRFFMLGGIIIGALALGGCSTLSYVGED